ncbi:FecR domain-containing protein, partial [Acinetobacter ursingii]
MSSGLQPFTVHTADGDLLALGTVFNVRHLSTQTELIVKQGIVRTQPRY